MYLGFVFLLIAITGTSVAWGIYICIKLYQVDFEIRMKLLLL
jgi:hypothetical protein